MLAIDTNVLVRLTAQDDARQLSVASQATAGGGWISHVVLAEALWVLKSSYGLSRNEIAATVDVLLRHASLVLEDADVVTAALAAFRANKRVAFSDCLILEIARKAGHRPLGTFDRDLAKLDGAERIGAKS